MQSSLLSPCSISSGDEIYAGRRSNAISSNQSPDAFGLPQLSYSPDSTHTTANKLTPISQLLQLYHYFHSSSSSHASLSKLFLTIAFQSPPKPVPSCHLELYLSVIKTTQLLLPAWTFVSICFSTPCFQHTGCDTHRWLKVVKHFLLLMLPPVTQLACVLQGYFSIFISPLEEFRIGNERLTLLIGT